MKTKLTYRLGEKQKITFSGRGFGKRVRDQIEEKRVLMHRFMFQFKLLVHLSPAFDSAFCSGPLVCGPQIVFKTSRYYSHLISPRFEAFLPAADSPTPKYSPHQQGRPHSVLCESTVLADGPNHRRRRRESAVAIRCDSTIVYSAAPSNNSARSARLVTLSVIDRAPATSPRAPPTTAPHVLCHLAHLLRA
ncbi:hypothetical protein B0H13DRAFT_1861381 [Mycena leptocephala]|nr:hypothetical protein B0H13DRAFT_1861381 [Mycena leptocephala]